MFWTRLRVWGGRSVLPALLAQIFLAGCTADAWNNPHGLLGGLFSPSRQGAAPTVTPSNSETTSRSSRSGFGNELEPPTFSHVVPLAEGDGIYLQWRRVENVSDYLVYNGNRLVEDVPTNQVRITGLLPCTAYQFRIYSSNGKRVSKNSLLVRVHTRGCLRTP
ncbi:MAG: fibronectin type III domain-containing protein [Nitrospirae bacterium]|nr:fibronectin type III domain-containing protein [Nitrospirota bacterium]